MRYTYKEAADILIKYYNDDGFCGVVSLCTATGLSVGKCYHLLRKHGRKHRQGTPFKAMVTALEEVGYSLETLSGRKMKSCDKWAGWGEGYYNAGIKTYGQVEKALKKGTYFIMNLTSKSAHVACIKDGVLNDWTVSSKRKTVRSIFRVVKTEEQ